MPKISLRNTDPTFWNKHHWNCNCASYALNLDSWYMPYQDDEDDKVIATLIENGYTRRDIMEILLKRHSITLFKDFGDILTEISEEEALNAPQEIVIIAYRLCLVMDEDWGDYSDKDFHFKIRINGVWREKNGIGEIHECELENGTPWCSYESDNDSDEEENSLVYDSRILYFIIKREN